MIEISREEADYLRNELKNINIIKTCRSKSNTRRGKRYVEESRKVKRKLDDFYRNRLFDSPTKRRSDQVMCQ